MKVKYLKCKESKELEKVFCVNKEYCVLEILSSPARGVLYRLEGNPGSGGPGIFSAKLFEVSDTKVPLNWVVEVKRTGMTIISPRKWRMPGFWEDFFDMEPEAQRIYQEELAKIKSE